MLKLNKRYKPIEAIENDEIRSNGIFQWNISKMIDYINQNISSISTSVIDVNEHYNSVKTFGGINDDHVNSVDTSIPIIQVEINPSKYLIIDGNHRIIKAYIDGIRFLKSYDLSVDQHIHFFITTKSYTSFVEYWNSKIITKGNHNRRKGASTEAPYPNILLFQ